MAMRAGTMTKEIQEPTAEQLRAFELAEIVEQQRSGRSVTIGKAFRRRRMIDTLLEAKVLAIDEHKALHVYRHHADYADRSPIRDSIAALLMIRGSGDDPGITLLNSIRIRNDCERAAGSLAPLLRAVVIDDVSLSAWSISRSGGIEKARRRGTVVEARPKALAIARLEIKVAAQRVQAELDA